MINSLNDSSNYTTFGELGIVVFSMFVKCLVFGLYALDYFGCFLAQPHLVKFNQV